MRVARSVQKAPILRSFIFALLGWLCSIPSFSWADEGEHLVSARLGYTSVSHNDTRLHGAILGVEYERGLNPSWWLRGSLDVLGGTASGETNLGTLAIVGGTYAFDVLHYIPYATAGVGALLLHGCASDDTHCIPSSVSPVYQFGLGIDKLQSRQRSFGLAYQYTAGPEITMMSVNFRMTWRWGFF